MSVKISALPAADSVSNADTLPIIRNGVTRKCTAKQLGVPDGGAAGQVLSKASGADRDTAWTDGPADQIVASSTTSLWNWVKYASGRMTATKMDSRTGDAFTVQEGTLYRCNTIEWTYPAAMTSITNFQISLKCAAAPLMWPALYDVNETSKIVKFAAFRPTSGTVYTPYTISVRLEGRWD